MAVPASFSSGTDKISFGIDWSGINLLLVLTLRTTHLLLKWASPRYGAGTLLKACREVGVMWYFSPLLSADSEDGISQGNEVISAGRVSA